ncbi:MAG: hypothetical protein R3214_00605 [Christiangramia sp.]|nr:hypothetical protein [Christiangramia sp.]
MLKKIPFCLILAVILPVYLVGQNNSIYETFDEIIGLENTVLYNGLESLDLQKTINEKNKFLFTSPNYNSGNIVYNRQFFPDILLKFNVVDDRVLVQIPINDQYSVFELITEKIETFSLNGHYFQKLNDSQEGLVLYGFYEQIFESSELSLFKKYRKKYKKRLDRSYVYYEYTPDDPEYYLKLNGKYHSVNSKMDVIDIFPEIKKEIRQTYRAEKDLRKNDLDSFMKLLFNKIVNLQI